MDDGRILIERDAGVMVIRIARAAKRNALTPAMIADYSQALADYDADDEACCALVVAEGDHFTAGLDLAKAAALWDAGGTLYPAHLPHICDIRPPYRRKPLVMAVQGISFTFGVEMMLAADVVIAASDCRFAVLETTRGIMASAGATFRLPAAAGWSNAMRWLLTGDEFGAEEAYRMGLVQEVVAPGAQGERAMTIAARIAAAAPLAVIETRANARLAQMEGFEAAVARLDEVRSFLRASDDAKEGLASFQERRPARFSGR
ncbi:MULTISPECIES: crotonase/enoyl-CoA hydratase family protein [unclassified Sphingobium]|uniref:crotonase/enoyl-CoA hydratase family protein n=1 Tax=unclassified Sphingobium TaxID=2611147 RepID=UPI000D165D13|nr:MULTISPECIES: crotonase/enoyl-CoA hydratase family protein [unclassified Sphingobium]MBG6120022.1 enoyl-CoA hydratase/carnithine racemase [Sphingobium sp. JAI105]PSO12921.1 enoyl-CoA hydratase [Sphingobium sp. AEW4]TWD05777.1 enoyl-CoA hydratase/carnithine racemase [Sphingobium sp. AEW010]TWD23330.1 enoyl-CoA hydratase/carnithine racemase [Sphingobium sp. AEW013]TWD25190.1 enoyl-CoA hydratase/carnithine racemase [Sphingobium sp. AEW001]